MKRGFLNRQGSAMLAKPTIGDGTGRKGQKEEQEQVNPNKPVANTKNDRAPTVARKPPSKDIPFEVLTEDVEVGADGSKMVEMLHKAGLTILALNLSIRMCAAKIPDTGKSAIFCAWLTYADLTGAFPVEHDWGPPDVPTPLPRPYRIAPSPGAGLGMFAARKISMGETIVIERPVIMIPRTVFGTSPASMNDAIDTMLAILPQDIQRRVRALSCCKVAPGQSELSGKITTNSLKCTFPQSKCLPLYGGVCLEISRCNHSCGPNAVWAFDSNNLFMELRASRDIAAGEEITITYIGATQPRADRQQALKSAYSFTCKCTHCKLPPSEVRESDLRRRRIDVTFGRAPFMWRAMMDDGDQRWQTLIEAFRKCVPCLEKEGLDLGYGHLDRYLAAAYAAVGDEPNFRTWAEKAARTEHLVENRGHGYLTGETWKAWSCKPSSIPCWKQRK